MDDEDAIKANFKEGRNLSGTSIWLQDKLSKYNALKTLTFLVDTSLLLKVTCNHTRVCVTSKHRASCKRDPRRI